MYFLQLLYLFLPAFIANAMPVPLMHVPGLRRWSEPIDARNLGKNKTWRGFLLSPLAAAAVGLLQLFLQHLIPLHGLVLLDGSWEQALEIGFAQGVGAMVGDSAKSFLKRRIGIAPGRAWPVIDGIDYMVGALALMAPFYLPTWQGILFLLVIGPLASLGANAFSFVVGWKKVWW